MNYQQLSESDYINKNLNLYLGDLSCIEKYIFNNNNIEKKYISMGFKKIIEEIIENIIDYINKSNISNIFYTYIDTTNNSYRFINEINFKMYDNIEINNVIVNKCIPEMLILNPRTSNKFNSNSNTIGMNGLGLKVIVPLCELYEVIVKIDDEYFIYIVKNNNLYKTIIKDYKDTFNLFNNYWSVKFILKPEYYDSKCENNILLNSKLYETIIYSYIINKPINLLLNNNNIFNDFKLENYFNIILKNNYKQINLNIEYNISSKNSKKINCSLYYNINKNINNTITIVNGKFIYKYLPNNFKSTFKDKINIDNNEIFKHLSFILILNNNKFNFTSQDKTNLAGTFNIISKLPIDLKDELLLILKNKKKKTIKDNEHYIKGEKNNNSELILVEGKSALTSVRSAVCHIKNIDSTIYSYYAVIGKLKNYIKSNVLDKKSVLEELTNIFESFNFKKIIIFSDADVDGIHIVCLILSLIIRKFKHLLDIVYIPILPSLICCNKFFITQEDVDNHVNEYKNNKHNINYCKGLASYTLDELSYIFQNFDNYFYKLKYSDEDLNYFITIMNYNSNIRKELYNLNTITLTIIDDKYINLKNYIQTKYKEFLHYSNKRCIPNLEDGLNPSTRKIIYFLRQNPNKISKITEISSSIIANLKYHHGDINLSSTFLRNSSTYPTGLNIPLFIIKGNGGSRIKNGKDHGAFRYISGYLNPILKYIFREEDDIILEKRIDECKEVEPILYYPIIPLILINFNDYIGTGFNCCMPTYNINDICDLLKKYINNNITDNSQNKIRLYVREFTGKLSIINNKIFKSQGNYEKKNNSLIITELPHFNSIDYFIKKLDNNNIKYKLLQNNTPNKPLIQITKIDDNIETIINKALINYKYINLVVYKNEKLIIYNNIENILKDYFNIRLNIYKKRKDKILYNLILEKFKLNIKKELFKNIINKYPKTIDEQNILINTIKDLSYNYDEFLYLNITENNIIIIIKNIFNDLKINNVQKSNLEKLIENYNTLSLKIENYKKTKIQDIWINEIDEFLNIYNTKYKTYN